MAVRSRYRSDGARRFHEVEGGLSKIKVSRFVKHAREAGLQIERLEPRPSRG